jgi:hypothetical protein
MNLRRRPATKGVGAVQDAEKRVLTTCCVFALHALLLFNESFLLSQLYWLFVSLDVRRAGRRLACCRSSCCGVLPLLRLRWHAAVAGVACCHSSCCCVLPLLRLRWHAAVAGLRRARMPQGRVYRGRRCGRGMRPLWWACCCRSCDMHARGNAAACSRCRMLLLLLLLLLLLPPPRAAAAVVAACCSGGGVGGGRDVPWPW